MNIKNRIAKLEGMTGINEENPIKAIEVCFVGPDRLVKSSFVISVDYGHRIGTEA